jgi:hypothetical protein
MMILTHNTVSLIVAMAVTHRDRGNHAQHDRVFRLSYGVAN